jgi:PTS system nitrogen regulatory IIA component
MKITSILKPEAIVPQLSAKDKDGILRELAQTLSHVAPSISAEGTYHVLSEREKLGSTGIGSGVAIPHGKMEELQHIVACFGRSTPGVNFESQDGEATHLFFAMVAPENSAGLHLQALAKLSRLLKNNSFRQKLLEAPDVTSLFQIISEEDEKS